MTGQDLEDSEFPRLASVVIAMPDQVTFRGGTGCSTIDYFCLNNAAQRGFRGVQVQSSWHEKAHRP
eukprot:8955625-Pyramimonas_sp.AAC.1